MKCRRQGKLRENEIEKIILIQKLTVCKGKVPDKINPMLWMKHSHSKDDTEMWKDSCELEELLKDQLKKVLRKALRIQWILKIWRMIQTMKSFFLSLRTKLKFVYI